MTKHIAIEPHASRQATLDGEACAAFIAAARLMLHPETPESVRRVTEPTLLAQLPVLQALGLFELFALRDPALRAWLADELQAQIDVAVCDGR